MASQKPQTVVDRITSAADVPSVVLVHGADRGLVREVAEHLATVAGGPDPDPFGTVTLDAAAVASDPGLLSDEARTVSLFGGRRVIHVRDGGTRNLKPALDPLLEDLPRDAVVIVEAGELRTTNALRKAIEGHRMALAVACYPDTARDLDRLMDQIAAEFGVTFERDARGYLHAHLGADRAASRSELEKACLFARPDTTVTLEHVSTIVGDASVIGVEGAVDAALSGDLLLLERELAKLATAGTNPGTIAGAAHRLTLSLARAALEIDAGTPARRAVERIVPPLRYDRRAHAERILARWSARDLDRAAAFLGETVLATRKRANLSASLVSDALFRLARQAAR